MQTRGPWPVDAARLERVRPSDRNGNGKPWPGERAPDRGQRTKTRAAARGCPSSPCWPGRGALPCPALVGVLGALGALKDGEMGPCHRPS